MSDELPTLPLTIAVGVDGTITTGNALEDKRLANAMVHARSMARDTGRRYYLYEHPTRGLEISTDPPTESYLEIFPGGRTVFRPKRDSPPESTAG